MMIINRLINIIIAVLLSLVFFFPAIIIFMIIKIDSSGPAIVWSNRIGYNSCEFKMPKFRSMNINTPQIATHLLTDPEEYLTRFGRFLRKTSLDEIPQLISIIKGDMNFIGPRPALYNQYDLIELRKENQIDKVLPGITGWAQVNGRDNITIKDKVELEIFYLQKKGFLLDIKIILKTLSGLFEYRNIKH